MQDKHNWEWLRTDANGQPNPLPDTEADAVQNLRRWVDRPATNGLTTPNSTEPPKSGERRSWLREKIAAPKQTSLEKSSAPKPPASAPTSPPPSLAAVPIPSVVPSARVHPTTPLYKPQVSSQRPTTIYASQPATIAQPPTAITKEKGTMPTKDNYRDYQRQDFTRQIEALGLKEPQQNYLKSRWLDQVLWMEGRANRARNWYNRLRLTAIIGGVIVPALIGFNFLDETNAQLKKTLAGTAFVLSQIVAVAVATEQFFNYGERWRHYRRSVESLKIQWWQFSQLTGPLQSFKTHENAFPTFVALVEDILQREVEVYASKITQPKRDDPSSSQSDFASQDSSGYGRSRAIGSSRSTSSFDSSWQSAESPGNYGYQPTSYQSADIAAGSTVLMGVDSELEASSPMVERARRMQQQQALANEGLEVSPAMADRARNLQAQMQAPQADELEASSPMMERARRMQQVSSDDSETMEVDEAMAERALMLQQRMYEDID